MYRTEALFFRASGGRLDPAARLMSSFFAEHVGHFAALTTSILWTGSTLFFAGAANRLGPTRVNTARLFIAAALLGVTHWLLSGGLFPEVAPKQATYLALSGLIGLTIGDQALFMAFVWIGPRVSTLLMTTAPIFAALFGFVALGETLPPVAWIGVAMTLGGVAWVVLERPANGASVAPGLRWRGVLLAIVGAACQAAGLMFSKLGMGYGWMAEADCLPPQSATFVRMSFAAAFAVPLIVVHSINLKRTGKRSATPSPEEVRAADHSPRPIRSVVPAGLLLTFLGATFGPFLGVWMSLVAAAHDDLGIAQTLMSLTPILILPVLAIMFGERISARAILGAVVAVSGVGVLFLA